MFLFKKKPVIKVSFEPYYNFPIIIAKNCTDEQILDAAILMKGNVASRKSQRRVPAHTNSIKREGNVRKFFRIIGMIISGKTVPAKKECRTTNDITTDSSLILPDMI